MGIVEVKNLSFQTSSTKEQETVREISFEVEKGEMFSVLGRNGSGKTLIARHLNALLKPEKGTVFVCSLDTSAEKNTAEIRQKCGMVFSRSRERFLNFYVMDEVVFALQCAGADKKMIREKAAEYLKYTGMTGKEKVRLDLLTEYEALCVQIASVLALEPEIIVLDDAAFRITGEDREKYFTLLKKLIEDGKTLIVFTGRYDEAALADRVLLLTKDGAAVCGKTRKVLTDRTLLQMAEIEMPFSLRVYYDLLDSDIKLDKPPLNMRELVDEICL